jgi:hypothetical protein
MRHLLSREPIPCWDVIRLGGSSCDRVDASDWHRCLAPWSFPSRSRAAQRSKNPSLDDEQGSYVWPPEPSVGRRDVHWPWGCRERSLATAAEESSGFSGSSSVVASNPSPAKVMTSPACVAITAINCQVGVEQARQLFTGWAALRQPVGQRREPGDVGNRTAAGEALHPWSIKRFLPLSGLCRRCHRPGRRSRTVRLTCALMCGMSFISRSRSALVRTSSRIGDVAVTVARRA